jgi:hypothetical protein
MEALQTLLLIAYYLLTGLYILVAATVASSCLAAVSFVFLRGLARDALDSITYGT